MNQGKGIILKISGLQTEKFYARMGREKLRYITVNTIYRGKNRFFRVVRKLFLANT